MGLTNILEVSVPEWETNFPPKPMLYHDDPLVLACGSYRIWKETRVRWTGLEDVVPTDADRIEAELLRKYYRERLVFDALKSTHTNTSEFRRKLGALVNNGLAITSREVGMLMRLPYFYEEDLTVDSIVAQVPNTTQVFGGAPTTGEFTLIKRVFRSRRQGDFYDYWMTSDISPGPFKLVVKSDNVLRGLIESLLEKPVKLSANIYTKNMRGYYRTKLVHQVVFTGTM